MVQILSWLHSTFKELSNEYSHAQIQVKTKKLWPRQVREEKPVAVQKISRDQEIVSRPEKLCRDQKTWSLPEKLCRNQKDCVATRKLGRDQKRCKNLKKAEN